MGLVILGGPLTWTGPLPLSLRADASALHSLVRRLVLLGGITALLAFVTLVAARLRIPDGFVATAVGWSAAIVLFTLALLLLRARN